MKVLELALEIQDREERLREELNKVSQVFVTPEEAEDDDNQGLYELPCVFYNNSGFATFWAVTEIKEGGLLKCAGLYEDFGEEPKNFTLEDLTLDGLVLLATIVE
jgi:hypothetical protein